MNFDGCEMGWCAKCNTNHKKGRCADFEINTNRRITQ